MRFRRVVFLILCTAYLLGWPHPVSAHAILLNSNPPANAIVDRSPAQVDLFLSEAVEPRLSRIQVLDSTGQAVDNQDTHLYPGDNSHLVVSVRSLADGVYTVSWSIVSAVDGHATSGSFPFTLGKTSAGAQTTAPETSSQAPLYPEEILLKGLLYLACAALAGGLLFSLLIWDPPADAVELRGFSITIRRFFFWALVGLGPASLLAVAGQYIRSASALDGFVAGISSLLSTRAGSLMLARILLGLTLVILLFSKPAPWKLWTAFGVSAFLPFTISLISHAAADPHPWLPVLLDTLHLLAASVWVGGLFLFVVALVLVRRLEPMQRTQLTAHLIPRFSNLALVSVGALVLTGLYSAYLEIGSVDALLSTVYGKALLVKTGLTAPLVAIGAINLLITSPRMRQGALEAQGNTSLVQLFQRLVRTEAVLGAVILLWVGLFTSLPPSKTNAAPASFFAGDHVDNMHLILNINPGRVGINTFKLWVSEDGYFLKGVKQVKIQFQSRHGLVPPSEAVMVANPDGTFTFQGANLSLPDQWKVQVVVIQPQKFDTYAGYQIDLRAASTANIDWKSISSGLLVGIAVLCALAWILLDRNQVRALFRY